MMRTRDRLLGVTLMELLVAMSIFSVFGLFLFTLMRDSLSIYRTARGSGEVYDKLDQTMRPLLDDLACVTIGDPEGLGPKVRFLATHDRTWVPPEGSDPAERKERWSAGDPRSFLLRFVRTFPGGELHDPVGRFAGTYPGAAAYIDGVADLEESRLDEILRSAGQGERVADRTPGLLAPRNLMEVVYFLDRSDRDAPGTFTLYRAYRAPPGGTGSFFAEDFPGRMSPEWVERHGRAIISGIAYFGIVFWSQNTRAWETERVLAGAGVRAGRDNEWAELWWDSTRARHREFSLHVGARSESVFEDDVFPARVRLTLTVVEEGRLAPDATLITAVAPTQRNVRISDPGLFKDLDAGGPLFLRVDDEWMEVVSAAGRDLKVVRGARRSAPARHGAGAAVLVGRTFRRTIEIPAHRAYFRSPGERVE